jgi:hypothetical protein
LAASAAPARAASLFASDGPWNAPLPAKPKLDPNSTAIVSGMALWLGMKDLQGDHASISTNTFSTPVYTVGSATPKQPISIDPGAPWQRPLIGALAAGVPFPADAQPAAGTNGHITVYDSGNDTLYEFWHASSPAMNAPGCGGALPWGAPCHGDGQWHADWGGAMDHATADPGFFSVNSWPGLSGTQGYNWGASATSLPLAGGLMTFDDLRSGAIDHALAGAFADVKTCALYFMYPAQREDGLSLHPDCLPEGARLQLDPSYDVAADSNPPLTKAIERAAQTYGIVVRDRTHGTFAFYGQDPKTEAVNPYTSGPGVGGVANGDRGFFGGLRPSQLFANFPWARLRVVASRRCTAAPCSQP